MNANLWEQGLDLMLYGMGTVFIFLTLLVIATMIMSNLVIRFLGEEPEPAVASAIPPGGNPNAISNTTLAVIQAAIHAHRVRQQNNNH